MSEPIEIFTDGACRGNPGPGGWGALIRFSQNNEKHLSGAEKQTTNNRMEMTAAIEALASLPANSVITLTTDSQYLRLGITEWLPNWKRRNWRTAANKPVKNVDLWQRLESEVSRHQVTWEWVKGHSGHPDNEQADYLATQAIDTLEI